MSNRDPLVRMIVNESRQRRLSYHQLNHIVRDARKALGLHPPNGPRRLPKLLTDELLAKFFEVIDNAENIQHQIMLRLLFYTAIRVGELTRIEVDDVDLRQSKIFINLGKGSKDRYVLFPEDFALILQSHLAAHPDNRYLFESNRKTRFSTRWIEKIVERYAAAAGVERLHPHLLRHQMLTFLTREGIPDSRIQLISGHTSKKSLERYQQLSLKDVADDYQAAVKKVKI